MKRIILSLLLVCMCALPMYAQKKGATGPWVTTAEGHQLQAPHYMQGDSYQWEGPVKGGKAHGSGKLTKYFHGTLQYVCEGTYRKGVLTGRGRFTWKDGASYEGPIVNGMLTGEGSFTAPDGRNYKGQFIHHALHGKGHFNYADGAVFEGFFVHDKPYDGKYTTADGKVLYVNQGKMEEQPRELPTSNYNPPMGKEVTEYFDATWKRCDKAQAAYYRKVTYQAPNTPKGVVRDYYSDGKLQSEFTPVYLDYVDEGKNFVHGKAIWYHTNGQLSDERFFFSNLPDSVHTSYYPDGKRKQVASFIRGTAHGPQQEWSQAGNLLIDAEFVYGKLKDGKFLTYDEAGLGTRIFRETFESESDWAIDFPNKNSSALLPDHNGVRLVVQDEEPTRRGIYSPVDQTKPYSVEAYVAYAPDGPCAADGYGLMFGTRSWQDYFYFLVNEKGEYSITGMFDGMPMEIAPWTPCEHLRPKEFNSLRVLKEGYKFHFFVNGKKVHTSQALGMRGFQHGLVAYGKGTYFLAQLEIKEYLDEKAVPAAALGL